MITFTPANLVKFRPLAFQTPEYVKTVEVVLISVRRVTLVDVLAVIQETIVK